MKFKAISDCITEKISGEWGTDPMDSAGTRIIRTTNFTNEGRIDFSDIVFRNIANHKIEKKKLRSGDVIIEKSGGSPTQPVGRVVFFENPDNQIYLCNNFTAILRPNPQKVFPKYLFYALFFNHRKGRTLKYQNRTTGIINLKIDKYLESSISVPHINDQIRIAKLLSCVEAMIFKRKESLILHDQLLKGIFLEMFGDPVNNDRGWDKPKLKNNFGEISTGNTPPRSNAENYSNNYLEWIKTDNINQDQMYLTPASEFLSATGAKKARTVTKGALLVACIAGSIESIGRAALADRRVSFNQQINAIQPYSDINPLFLYWLFRISKVYIQSFAPRGMKKILTKGNFEKITMIKPQKEIQDKFASIVEKAEYLKTLYQQSLNELENLYGALSQKAFKGKLDLSRIPIEPLAQAKDLEPEQLPIAFPPLDHKVMADPAAREKLLRQIFKEYFTEPPKRTGSFKDFWNSVEFSVSDYMDDESPPLGPADYDKFKTWLFDLLKSGQAEQRFNEEKNKMELRTKP